MTSADIGSVAARACDRLKPGHAVCRGLTRRHILALPAFTLTTISAGHVSAAEGKGQLTWGLHISLAPTWFDPAETPSIITPYLVMYAVHDALVKSMPGQLLAPGLAESWTLSDDGLTYEFVLRKDIKFHNGDAVTAEDVKFSFERYRGTASKTLKDRVAGVETPDSQRVRFTLRQQWPDFLTFYASASGAGWIVPKKYVERVGDEGYKRAPIGAGPYKFVSFTPGVELTLEAFDQYWRKTPSVKYLVFKVIPDEATRLAALKRGEVDIAYSIRGELADELQRAKGLTLKSGVTGNFWLYFADQWDAKSPWQDQRVRLAASLAIDRNSINQALTLGYSQLTGSIISQTFDFYWQPPSPVYDPARAKQLLAEAGYPKGFAAGDYFCDISYASLAEAVLN
jgi:peptide/nickel transport system substrate-binding protein